jgi:pyruvate dehydrogenase E2 component (dihydrolipoamide acetyltransferase)
MNINMKMPDLATNAGTELGIARWIAQVGQPVKRGQAILEVETDNGVLQAIHVQAGEKVAVGTVIATIKVD